VDEEHLCVGPRGPPGEQHPLDDGGALVEHRGVRGREPGEVGDHGLEVEERLEPSLRDLGLVGRVRRVPAGVLEHIALDHRGRVGAVVAEPDHRPGDPVAGRERTQLGERLRLRRGGRQAAREVGGDADARGDGGVDELLDARVAEHPEHRLLGRGVGADVTVGEARRHSAINDAYSSAVSIVGSDAKRTAIIQPAPSGSELTREGSSPTAWFVSTTSPSTGAYSSPTDLVDSISPTTRPAVTAVPTAGSSTKTTSPSCSAAYSVMPMRATSPSTATHSCSAV